MLLALRINVLAKGHSGISLNTLQQYVAAFNGKPFTRYLAIIRWSVAFILLLAYAELAEPSDGIFHLQSEALEAHQGI